MSTWREFHGKKDMAQDSLLVVQANSLGAVTR